MAAAQQAVHDGSTLVEAVKTTARLVPRQVTDELELAKLELGHKKARVGGIATFGVLAFARHPVLRDLGFTVLIGCGLSLVFALFVRVAPPKARPS